MAHLNDDCSVNPDIRDVFPSQALESQDELQLSQRVPSRRRLLPGDVIVSDSDRFPQAQAGSVSDEPTSRTDGITDGR